MEEKLETNEDFDRFLEEAAKLQDEKDEEDLKNGSNGSQSISDMLDDVLNFRHVW
jgi:hypothetical protein